MMNKQMIIYKHYLTMLSKNYVNSVLCYSKAGYGKSYTTIKILKELKQKYKYISGITTTLQLYKELYNTNNKILIIDDIETMFKDDKTINILKSALWEVDGKRVVSYKTSSKTLEEYPQTFNYTGKIIILANEIKGKNDESFRALMSRCLKYELKYTHEELKKISNQITEQKQDLTQKQKQQIQQIIKKHIKPEHNFNFRLLERLISFVKYETENPKIKAEELFVNSLDIDDETEIIIQINKKYKNAEEQIKQYKKQTGKSRMSYYRKKKKLKTEGYI